MRVNTAVISEWGKRRPLSQSQLGAQRHGAVYAAQRLDSGTRPRHGTSAEATRAEHEGCVEGRT